MRRQRKRSVLIDLSSSKAAALRKALDKRGVTPVAAAEAARILLADGHGPFFPRWVLALQATGISETRFAGALQEAGVKS